MRRFIAVLVVIVAVIATYFIASNNQDISMPGERELRAHHEKAIDWMLANRADILVSTNNILWWMVMRSAELTGDPRLNALYAEYKQLQLDPHPGLVWQHYFDRNSLAPVIFSHITHFPDYNLLFVYGLTCDRELATMEVIKQQQRADFCAEHHPISPACVTHQMMGIRFMLERGCGDPDANQALLRVLQDKVVTQLIWDPRVVDVYLQRVLMLLDTGARERVKPIWVRNIIEAQRPDGGWGQVQAFLPVGNSRAFGFTARGIGVGSTRSDFHASAQGLLVLSLLLYPPTP